MINLLKIEKELGEIFSCTAFFSEQVVNLSSNMDLTNNFIKDDNKKILWFANAQLNLMRLGTALQTDSLVNLEVECKRLISIFNGYCDPVVDHPKFGSPTNVFTAKSGGLQYVRKVISLLDSILKKIELQKKSSNEL